MLSVLEGRLYIKFHLISSLTWEIESFICKFWRVSHTFKILMGGGVTSSEGLFFFLGGGVLGGYAPSPYAPAWFRSWVCRQTISESLRLMDKLQDSQEYASFCWSICQTSIEHLPFSDWLKYWRGGSIHTVMADAGVKNDIRSNMWRTGAWQSLLTFCILSLAWLVGFSSRLFAVIRFESIIHEFDPW